MPGAVFFLNKLHHIKLYFQNLSLHIYIYLGSNAKLTTTHRSIS
jgi:hypothetical protein